jgi:hypothetical protein
MGYLTIFSETGTPHNGCLLEYGDGGFEWLSFMPRSTSIFDVFPGGNYGTVDTNDREAAIDAYARFRIGEEQLVKGRNKTVTDYYSANYGLFICDCVSFARDMSVNCGLSGGGIAYEPAVLVNTLISLNQSKLTHANYKPYPWKVHRQKQPLMKAR